MNATELVAKLSETHGVSEAQAKSIVDDFLEDLWTRRQAARRCRCQVSGSSKSRRHRNSKGGPAGGEKIKIAASKKLTFASAKSVKDLLNR